MFDAYFSFYLLIYVHFLLSMYDDATDHDNKLLLLCNR
jgi:hypothetical protein